MKTTQTPPVHSTKQDQTIHQTKILYVITSAEFGGAQTHLQELVQHLDQKQFSITVACSNTGPLLDALKELNIPVIEIPSLKREIDISQDIKTLFVLFRLCRKHRFDILHAHSSKAGFLGRVAAYFARVPVIIFSVHGFAFNPEISPFRKRIYKVLEFIAGKLSRKVICVSHADLEQAIREGIIPARRVLQIANGVDVERFSSKASERIRKELTIASDAPVVTMVARLVTAKGQDVLLRAFAIVHKKHPRARLLLVGDGPDRSDFEALAATLNIKHAVIFTGYRQDIPEILASTTVFAFSSHSEAQPYAILEAMAAKKPVVATQVGGIPELITHEENGLLFPDGNSDELAAHIIHFIENPEHARKCAERAHADIIESYNLEKSIQQTVTVYKQLLDSVGESLQKVLPVMLGIGDAIIFNLAFFIAFVLRFKGEVPSINFVQYTQHAVLLTLLQMLIFSMFNLYDPHRRYFHRSVIIPQVIKSTSLMFLLFIFYRWIGQQLFDLPRTVMLLTWLFTNIGVTIWHALIARIYYLPRIVKNTIIIGEPGKAAQLAKTLGTKPHLGYHVQGYMHDQPPDASHETSSLPYLGSTADLLPIAQQYAIDAVIVIPEPDNRERIVRQLILERNHPLEVNFLPTIADLMVSRTNHQLLADIPLVTVPINTEVSGSGHAKRLIEILCSTSLLILLSPLFLAISMILMKAHIKPLIDAQPRLGKKMHLFNLWRFRLTPPSEKKQRLSPFLTYLLKLIHTYRLDGLPQLCNILAGDMSFIGPQPEHPSLAEQYILELPGYRERFQVKPGVIGLAQVNGAYKTGDPATLTYDLIYTYNYSLFRDLTIVRDSLRRVFTTPRV